MFTMLQEVYYPFSHVMSGIYLQNNLKDQINQIRKDKRVYYTTFTMQALK
jgi:hypothetical protein